MKKIILTVAIFCTTFVGANAQEGHEGHNHAKGEGYGKRQKMNDMTPEQVAAEQTRIATKQLTLTPEQGEKFNALTLDRVTSNRALRERMKAAKDKATKQDIRKQVETNKTNFDNNVLGMLTPEQAKLWEAKRAKMKENQTAKKEDRKEERKAAKGKGKGKVKEVKNEVEEEIED